MATILSHQGVSITPDALESFVYLPEREGSLQAEIVAAIRQHNMIAMELTPDLDTLILEVAAGNPVLVLQNLGNAWLPRWHYAVVVGYDLNRKQFVLRSGAHKRWVTDFSVFDRTWQRGQRWGLVALPAGRMPVTAQPMNYLKAASALEATGLTQAAYEAYKSAVIRWPENLIALMGLGNAAYTLKDYSASERAFRDATDHHPLNPATWNNLAYALAQQGCREEAETAASCAAKLSPADTIHNRTLDEIRNLSSPKSAQQCAPVDCPAKANKALRKE